MILELLLTTEAERDELKCYVPKYYEADKRAGILEEKLKTNKANEIMFGTAPQARHRCSTSAALITLKLLQLSPASTLAIRRERSA